MTIGHSIVYVPSNRLPGWNLVDDVGGARSATLRLTAVWGTCIGVAEIGPT